MGRKIKRVPLDFDWPLGKGWGGYISPPEPPCPEGCVAGLTPEGRWVEHIAHLLLIAGTNPDHPWLPQVPAGMRAIPELAEGLAGRPPALLGHDAFDRRRATRGIIEAAGLSEEWATCPGCSDREVSDWEPTEPPEGEGWQVWETVSEGSPVTPVFDSPQELAIHMSTVGVWGKVYEFSTALRFILEGWAPTAVIDQYGMRDGVEAS